MGHVDCKQENLTVMYYFLFVVSHKSFLQTCEHIMDTESKEERSASQQKQENDPIKKEGSSLSVRS